VTPLDDAVAAARDGELIVFPTDTVYGIATSPDDPAATSRLFEAKGRSTDSALPVLVASVEVARTIARFDGRAERLATLWPGALTLILPREERSRAWELGGDPGSVGVRVPRHLLARALLEAAGPLAVSSANRSGEPPARTCDELRSVFGERVSVYLCQDEPLVGTASTVVDLTGDDARLVRAGALDPRQIDELLAPEGPLLHSPPPR
jgi:tRNA threonylcarbamoyl adenosine modification protein (Sua5/YciO/YrdC/YwlC family)